MKTLDEVIKANECCEHGEPDSRCEDCPYKGIGFCCLERENDALHYLKEYRDECNNIVNVHDDYIRLRNEMAEDLNKANPALSWDELKSMEGKPVWIEHPETKIGRWIVIAKITGRNEELACMHASDAWGSYWKKYQGLEWQAYRKERK